MNIGTFYYFFVQNINTSSEIADKINKCKLPVVPDSSEVIVRLFVRLHWQIPVGISVEVLEEAQRKFKIQYTGPGVKKIGWQTILTNEPGLREYSDVRGSP